MKLAKFDYGSEYAWISPGSSKYALIYMNVSTYASILHIPKSAEIYPNMVGKHD